jgi:predicted polyphosphate/ATP-dependent NAD kinase
LGPRKKRLGILVNPIAGMGGKVGLRGTDGSRILVEAGKLGAPRESPKKTIEALRVLARMKDELEVFAYPGEMGEDEVIASRMPCTVLGSLARGDTTPGDTARAAIQMRKARVDLLLFAGGDGTARDVCAAVGRELTVLGIPTGVKMHSAVFAKNPRAAGEAAAMFLRSAKTAVVDGEVMDIDERAFRKGVVTSKLYGYLQVPDQERFIQGAKSGGFRSEKESTRGMAEELLSRMEEGSLYILGPGATTRDVVLEIGLEKTLLGVDVLLNGQVVAKDVTERELVRLMEGRKATIVTTVIGGQGYIFGRGNQQISARVIRRVGKDNIIIVASRTKLGSLEGGPLLVDTGDARTDESLSGYVRVITGLKGYTICKIEG